MKIHTPEYDREMKKRSAESETELRSGAGACLGALFVFGSLIVLFFVMSGVGFKVAERVTVSVACGADRYAAGLRFVNARRFVLTDGTTLAGGYQALYMAVAFFCVVVVLGPHVLLLQRMGLLREGNEARKRPIA